jgi:hypothetical protein
MFKQKMDKLNLDMAACHEVAVDNYHEDIGPAKPGSGGGLLDPFLSAYRRIFL